MFEATRVCDIFWEIWSLSLGKNFYLTLKYRQKWCLKYSCHLWNKGSLKEWRCLSAKSSRPRLICSLCSHKKGRPRLLYCLTTNEAFSSECAHCKVLCAATCSFCCCRSTCVSPPQAQGVSPRNNDRAMKIEIQLGDILLNSFGIIESICIRFVWNDSVYSMITLGAVLLLTMAAYAEVMS